MFNQSSCIVLVFHSGEDVATIEFFNCTFTNYFVSIIFIFIVMTIVFQCAQYIFYFIIVVFIIDIIIITVKSQL